MREHLPRRRTRRRAHRSHHLLLPSSTKPPGATASTKPARPSPVPRKRCAATPAWPANCWPYPSPPPSGNCSSLSARLGQPMCGDCYDYTAVVLFNAYAGDLWRRFTTYLPRHLARLLGITQKQLPTWSTSRTCAARPTTSR
ncbi:MAG: replication initiator [Streptosporangiaceae bacterium]